MRKLSVVTALVVILSFAAGLAGGGHFGAAGASLSSLVTPDY
jgi:nanoRNase/pAp phosphatase (c-di-AMP/oligoRNAs hydrolase)